MQILVKLAKLHNAKCEFERSIRITLTFNQSTESANGGIDWALEMIENYVKTKKKKKMYKQYSVMATR